MTSTATPDPTLGPLVRKAVAGRSFASLATTSAAGRAHVAAILYAVADGSMWISTDLGSRKARNVVENPAVAVTVAVRRIPFGPPASIAFQGRAKVVPLDDARLQHLAGAGALEAVTSHGELEHAGGCFLEVELPARVPAYGLGMPLRQVLKDPLAAGRVALVDWN